MQITSGGESVRAGVELALARIPEGGGGGSCVATWSLAAIVCVFFLFLMGHKSTAKRRVIKA